MVSARSGKREGRRAPKLFLAGLGLAALLPAALAQQPPAAAPPVPVVEMTARKYRYSPATIRVKQGAKVELKITALDHDHGFKISLYPEGDKQKAQPGLVLSSSQDSWVIKKGRTETIEFVAARPGDYPFHCSHFCGFGHRGMKGHLIVEP
jgi:cytochrome c oxidase subunit 2